VVEGDHVFVPGATCYGEVRGLFGGAASRVVVPGKRLARLDLGADVDAGAQATLLALAATAQHAIAGGPLPELIVGHGVLGRLLARLAVAAGGAPVVWERNERRMGGAQGYTVCDPDADARRDYRVVCDVSGDSDILDMLVSRLAPGGEIVLAGFYSARLSFAFPPAFMREARLRIAAQWRQADLDQVQALHAAHLLSLDGLVTHRREAAQAEAAYHTAFEDSDCLKMVLDWRSCR
jgi:3-hydroxyethyl bacteriochlorophyllide a dehydrogenase